MRGTLDSSSESSLSEEGSELRPRTGTASKSSDRSWEGLGSRVHMGVLGWQRTVAGGRWLTQSPARLGEGSYIPFAVVHLREGKAGVGWGEGPTVQLVVQIG